jgi:hypothetical protein
MVSRRSSKSEPQGWTMGEETIAKPGGYRVALSFLDLFSTRTRSLLRRAQRSSASTLEIELDERLEEAEQLHVPPQSRHKLLAGHVFHLLQVLFVVPQLRTKQEVIRF